MAGSASSCRSASTSSVCFSCGAGRATANRKLGLSNPVATRRGSRSPSRRSTSAATRGVAEGRGASSARPPRARAAAARRKGAGGGGGGEGGGRGLGPPLGDAVGLGYHEQPHRRPAELLADARRGRPVE